MVILQKVLIFYGYTLGDSYTAIDKATKIEKETMEKLLDDYLQAEESDKDNIAENITIIADSVIDRYNFELIERYYQ